MKTLISRRSFVRIGGLGLLAGACTPVVTAPTPGDAPTSGVAAPASNPGWEVEWDKLVTAALQEGKVVVQTAAGAGHRKALEEFNKAFPGVEVVEQTFPDSSTYVPKVKAERQAGIYSLDAAVTAPGSMLQQLKPEGVFDPLRPVLIRPDILDDKVWEGGFEQQWLDLENRVWCTKTGTRRRSTPSSARSNNISPNF
ncbi:MAG: hypothetical protein EXR51_11320 [Dehalococcoidia bacterium]|nr:hypothetical protein [Dehalococcoidia bacterium]